MKKNVPKGHGPNTPDYLKKLERDDSYWKHECARGRPRDRLCLTEGCQVQAWICQRQDTCKICSEHKHRKQCIIGYLSVISEPLRERVKLQKNIYEKIRFQDQLFKDIVEETNLMFTKEIFYPGLEDKHKKFIKEIFQKKFTYMEGREAREFSLRTKELSENTRRIDLEPLLKLYFQGQGQFVIFMKNIKEKIVSLLSGMKDDGNYLSLELEPYIFQKYGLLKEENQTLQKGKQYYHKKSVDLGNQNRKLSGSVEKLKKQKDELEEESKQEKQKSSVIWDMRLKCKKLEQENLKLQSENKEMLKLQSDYKELMMKYNFERAITVQKERQIIRKEMKSEKDLSIKLEQLQKKSDQMNRIIKDISPKIYGQESNVKKIHEKDVDVIKEEVGLIDSKKTKDPLFMRNKTEGTDSQSKVQLDVREGANNQISIEKKEERTKEQQIKENFTQSFIGKEAEIKVEVQKKKDDGNPEVIPTQNPKPPTTQKRKQIDPHRRR